MNLRILLFALLLAGSACKSRKPDKDTTPPVTDSVAIDPPQVPACKAITQGQAREGAILNGFSSNVNGDCLEMKVTYSGGCKTHDFQLFWDGAWAESLPPQVTLRLQHINNDDHCRSLLNEKLSFDLKPVRYAGVGQVIINLIVPGQANQRANYTY